MACGDFEPGKLTGLVYDEYMLLHKNEWDANHIEKPIRLEAVLETIREDGLEVSCHKIDPIEASDDLLQMCAPAELIRNLEKVTVQDVETQEQFCANYEDIYVNEHSLKAAKLSCGSAINAIKHVVDGSVRNALALVRPPGHHAYWDQPCGFCLFNNVAICAKYALDVLKLDRVMIVDWDVHAGQGTQYAFKDDPRCLFFSIHRFEEGKFWPNLPETNWDYIGEGAGTGYNINVPLNYTGFGDAEYLYIFDTLIMPLALQFNPQLVLVSAGFDSGFGDPEGEMRTSPGCYGHLTSLLMQLAGGRVCVVLEGGYLIDSLRQCAAYTLKSLLGDPPPKLPPIMQPHVDVRDTALCLMNILSKHWNWCAAFLRIHLHIRKQLNLPENSFPDVAEYNGVREFRIPYPTREQYPPRPPELEENLREELRIIMADYKSRPTEQSLMVFHNKHMSDGHCMVGDTSLECPQRLTAAVEAIDSNGVRVVEVEQLASEVHILYVHASEYIQNVKDLQDGWILGDAQEKYPTFGCKGTYDAASSAVQCTIEGVEHVMEDKCRTALCLVRPPGHHAKPEATDGFCFFNNVAIAARYLQIHYSIKKILIVDVDVHFGDGTLKIFEHDPSVLYISLHAHNLAQFYPQIQEGGGDNLGSGAAKGTNMNVAWNEPKSDQDYVAAFHTLILPAVRRFAPDFVLVSAGFDALKGDPIGAGCVSLSDSLIPYFISYLSTLAQSRILAVLEGGYNLENMRNSVKKIVDVLRHGMCRKLPELETDFHEDTVSTISKLFCTFKDAL